MTFLLNKEIFIITSHPDHNREYYCAQKFLDHPSPMVLITLSRSYSWLDRLYVFTRAQFFLSMRFLASQV